MYGTLALCMTADMIAASAVDARGVACTLQVAVDHIVRDGHVAGSGIVVDLRITHDHIARHDGTRVGAAPVIAADLQIAVDHSALDEGWPGIVDDLHIVQNRAALCETRAIIVFALEIAVDLNGDGKTGIRVAVIPCPRTVLNLEITPDGNRAGGGQEHRFALMALNVAVDRAREDQELRPFFDRDIAGHRRTVQGAFGAGGNDKVAVDRPACQVGAAVCVGTGGRRR